MLMLYLLMALLSASIVIKLVSPLLAPGSGGAPTRRQDRAVAMTMIVLLPLLALALYHVLGQPDQRGSPVIGVDYQRVIERNRAALALRPTRILLTQNAEDIGALVSMGQVNYGMGRYGDAAQFFGRAVEIAARDDDFRLRIIANMQGEALIAAADGVVTPQAHEVFAYILSLYPQSPIGRHFMALEKAQQGHYQQALDEWQVLLSEGPTGAYWKKRVREDMARVREQLRVRAAAEVTP